MKRPRTKKGPPKSAVPLEDAEQGERASDEEGASEGELLADATEPAVVEEAALERILPDEKKHLVPFRDPVRRFVEEARRHARLDENEERELGRAAREHGDLDAARRLVVHNLRPVSYTHLRAHETDSY